LADHGRDRSGAGRRPALAGGAQRIYRERRDLILDVARDRHQADKPVASLYIWAKTPPATTSEEFAAWLLNEAGISITPGTAFGQHGEGYVRISVGMSTARVREAMDRLREASVRLAPAAHA
jgi:LL-diaminopimelate aminotransferase